MKVKFDSLNRFEIPKMYVCSPGCIYDNGLLTNVVGCLSDTSDEELVLNFNSTSELNIRVNRIKRSDPDENNYSTRLYRSLQNRRLIFVEDIGFFIISSVIDGTDGLLRYKDIRAESCEIEISQKMLPYIENGTYKFSDLIEKILSVVPMWSAGYIDPVINERYRTFEDVSEELNVLAFLQENVQDAYECICLFDTVHRTISFFDQSNYVRQTNIHITRQDVVNSIEITENSDDLYTALNVLGDENLNISPINPLGTNVIYNFDYYMDWMTPSLSNKVRVWQELVRSKMDEYYDVNLRYYQELTKKQNLNAEMDKLATQLTMYRRCRDNIVATGSTSGVEEYNQVIENAGGSKIELDAEVDEVKLAIDEQIAAAQDEYDDAAASLEQIESEINGLLESILSIHNEVSITDYFTSDEYAELYNYIYEGSYRDNYITVTQSMSYEDKFKQMKVLYDRSISQLERISKPVQEFSVDVENFIFIREFSAWSEQLETGALINVELDDDDIAMLFLSNFTINYSDHSLSMTFGNRFTKFDPKSMFENVMGDIKKSANTLDYVKDIIYPIKNGELNSMKEAIETSRTLTKNAVLSSTNQEVIIDDTGYTGRQLLEGGLYDPKQIKITGKSIVFTDDAWETCKVALGEILLGDGQTTYGISAETVIGNMIIGNNLRILDNKGNDLLTVVDDRITASVSNYEDRISALEVTADGVNIRVTALEQNDEVHSVTTTTGYKFNEDGLYIHKDGEEIVNRLDNTGMYVNRGNDAILVANNEGVEAINLTAKQYLIVGLNSRFENYSNGVDTKRTGCFYIGG